MPGDKTIEFGYQIKQDTPVISSRQNFSAIVGKNPTVWLPTENSGYYEFYRVEALSLTHPDRGSSSVDSFHATNALSWAHHLVTTNGDIEGMRAASIEARQKACIYIYHQQNITTELIQFEDLGTEHKRIKSSFEQYLDDEKLSKVESISIVKCRVPKKDLDLLGFLSTTTGEQNKGCFAKNQASQDEVGKFSKLFQEILRTTLIYGATYTVDFCTGTLVKDQKNDTNSIDSSTFVKVSIPPKSSNQEIQAAMTEAILKSTRKANIKADAFVAVGDEKSAAAPLKEITPANPVRLLEALGISPIVIESASSYSSKLMHFFRVLQKLTQGEIDKLFTHSVDEEDTTHRTWVITFAGQELARYTYTVQESIPAFRKVLDKRDAKEKADAMALLTLIKDPVYFKDFLIEVPDGLDPHPIDTLKQFFNSHSIYAKTNEVLAAYPRRPRESHFECILTFKGVVLSLGQGLDNTKDGARDIAHRKTFEMLLGVINKLDAESAFNLSMKLGGIPPALAAVQAQGSTETANPKPKEIKEEPEKESTSSTTDGYVMVAGKVSGPSQDSDSRFKNFGDFQKDSSKKKTQASPDTEGSDFVQVPQSTFGMR